MKKFFEICLITLILFSHTYAQSEDSWFDYLGSQEGLPDINITSISQDYLGYLWIGTYAGLVKYDGYSMKVYKPETDNSNSISSQIIQSIYEDKEHILWIGTDNGLNKFIRGSEGFERYKFKSDEDHSINSDNVKSIYEANNGKLWIGTDKGLDLMDRIDKKFFHYSFKNSTLDSLNQLFNHNPNKQIQINTIISGSNAEELLLGLQENGIWIFDITRRALKEFKEFKIKTNKSNIGIITSSLKTSDGTIWLTSTKGVCKLNFDNSQYVFYDDFSPTLGRELISFASLAEDQNRQILAGSLLGEGLFCIDPENGNYKRYIATIDNHSLWLSNIQTITKDHSGIIWLGGEYGMLAKWDRRRIKFNIFMPEGPDPNKSWGCYSVLNDSNGFLWYLNSKGFFKLNDKTREITDYSKFYKIGVNGKLLQDKSGYIWIVSTDYGLTRFNPRDESVKYFSDSTENLDFSINKLNCAIEDREGLIWLGTLNDGVVILNPRSESFTNFKNIPGEPYSLSNGYIACIYEDKGGTVWIGTEKGGLDKFDRSNQRFKHIEFSNNIIQIMHEDYAGNFWIGVRSNGLSLFDRKNEKIIAHFEEEDGLTDNNINAILEDENGNLWMSTYNGIFKFDLRKKTFKNYGISDGIVDPMFILHSSSKSVDGKMYFTNIQGIVSFHPDSIKDDPIPPQVVIENISLFNRPDENLSYEGFISELEEIELPYNQNDLHFEYVGLHFSEPSKNKYKYILEGFDKKWIDAGNLRTATYTNLDPGEYIFKVNAANRDGVWNGTGASIKIIINPPIWATIWAYLMYVVFALSLIYFLWKLNLRRIRVKHEFEMSKFEAEKLHEVDELKSRFFANISHEFRTPLTLILGPAKDIIDSTKEVKIKQNAGLIKKNAGRLLRLVNQLLDLSKLEAGKMKLETREQDIIFLLKGLVLSFSSLADLKKIKLDFSTTQNGIDVYLDKDKIEKIINNILSNAFKFTPEGGRIDVVISTPTPKSPPVEGTLTGVLSPLGRGTKGVGQASKFVEIIITDTGVGIPKEKLDKIFDRFYQVDGSHTREQEGTGIGLALTKELVELHKGKIEVESEKGKGTTFIVRIPLGKEHLKPEEIIEEKVREEIIIPVSEAELVDEITTRKEKTDIDMLLDADKPLLLIVEDNGDVLKYIISHLEDNYRIQGAVDGEDGLDQAFNNIPDLIISDVMMPKMDGFEMCNKLKTDERTSHIPIIMLTAKATSQDKISGYETGADDYIMKPFDATELKVRVKNLIDIRRKLQEKFRSNDFTVPPELSSIDEQFMKRVLNVINEHISEEEFSIDELGKEVAMSRQHLHRKLKALTDRTPSQFVRSVRLIKARGLIKQKKGTISEISFSVGFGSPAYFNKCFKEEFGYSPGEIIQ